MKGIILVYDALSASENGAQSAIKGPGVILDIDRTLVHSVEKYVMKIDGKEEK